MRLSDEVPHETERRWLVDPGADPAAASNIWRLEEAEALDQKGLFLWVRTDSDAGSAFVDLKNSERAARGSEVGVTPGLDFGSPGQSHTDLANPAQRIGLLPQDGVRRRHRTSRGLKLGFSMIPNLFPNGSATAATLIPPPTSVT